MASNPISFKPNRKSADPLYRQLADEINYRVATGSIPIGAKLPTVAAGAKLWGVNLHTVRQAYADLAYDGIADVQRGRGTFVTAKPVQTMAEASPGATAGVASFVDWITSHAKRNFGLDRETLAELLVAPPPRAHAEKRLPFVECSSSQSSHHANEIARMWDVKTRGWSLEWDDEPPPGPFVATYFHYNDIRRRWPHRMGDANFVSIHPARNLAKKIKAYCDKYEPAKVCLYERGESMARSIGADITAALAPDGIEVQPVTITISPRDIRNISNVLYLFPPRVWWEASDDHKSAANVLQVEYEIAEPDMARLAHQFGWKTRASS